VLLNQTNAGSVAQQAIIEPLQFTSALVSIYSGHNSISELIFSKFKKNYLHYKLAK